MYLKYRNRLMRHEKHIRKDTGATSVWLECVYLVVKMCKIIVMARVKKDKEGHVGQESRLHVCVCVCVCVFHYSQRTTKLSKAQAPGGKETVL